VAGQAATGLENARLYQQLQLKAGELARLREFSENVLQSLDDGLVVVDRDGRILWWNRALELLYGVPAQSAIGRTLTDVFDMRFVDAVTAALREEPDGATLSRVPLVTHRAPDDRLLLNVTVVPLRQHRDGGVDVTGSVLIFEDITERVELEKQLQVSEKMASIGLLAAGVAHEVNTPLTGIASFTQMLLEGADTADPRTKLLEKIERQTFRAAKIVNGLLTLSRQGGPNANERSAVDLHAVVSDVLGLLEHQLENGKVKVRRELAPTALVVEGSEYKLQQVFLNLFLNARDAMPRGGWLSVTSHIEDGHAIVEVADTGSGIPSEHLARIYDPFFTTKAIGQGTGLGLSIAYGIIREHDGAIHVDSNVGQGTRFVVRVPVSATFGKSREVG
jgi:PAS domain S-box-containing protein